MLLSPPVQMALASAASSIRHSSFGQSHIVAMGRSSSLANLVLGLLFVASLASAVREELHLGEPHEILRSHGGSIEEWDVRVLRDANVAGARITLRQNGLFLPKYSDSASIAYVEEGEGIVGLLTGYSLAESSRVRRVRRGDVVALPRGFAGWWYNSGEDELRILAVADTSASQDGEYTAFHLIGGGSGESRRERRRERREREGEERGQERFRGILHGFSRGLLADAWDVDESQVDELRESQRGAGIVLAEREIRLPLPEFANRASRSAERADPHLRDYVANGEFVYNVREGSADVRVRDAGFYNSVNRFKLPILETVDLGLTYGRIESNAIVAPQWSPTGHEIVHILRGSADLQIVGNSGEQLVDREVREGDAYVVPRFYAHGLQAGDEGLEWISFYTTDQPLVEALAGRTSVLRRLPEQVAAAAFNIDVEQVREARDTRREREALLLPAAGRRRERRHA